MRMNGEADTNPRVEVGLAHRPLRAQGLVRRSASSPQLLNGRTGRLYKALVAGENPVATSVQASASARQVRGRVRRRGRR